MRHLVDWDAECADELLLGATPLCLAAITNSGKAVGVSACCASCFLHAGLLLALPVLPLVMPVQLVAIHSRQADAVSFWFAFCVRPAHCRQNHRLAG